MATVGQGRRRTSRVAAAILIAVLLVLLLLPEVSYHQPATPPARGVVAMTGIPIRQAPSNPLERVPSHPAGLLVAPNGSSPGSVVGTFDLVNNTLYPGNVRPANSFSPEGIAYDAANGDLYVADTGGGRVTVVNVTTLAIVATIDLSSGGWGPSAVAYDPIGNTIDLGFTQSATVIVLSGTNNSPVANLSWSAGGLNGSSSARAAFAVAPSLGEVFVSHGTSIAVVNSTRDQIVRTFSPGGFADTLDFDPLSGRLYVPDVTGSDVLAVDPSSGSVVGTYQVPQNPYAVAVDPGNGTLYVGSWQTGNVTVIDPASGAYLGNISVGPQLDGLTFAPGYPILFALQYGQGNVTVLNTSRMAVTGTVPVGRWIGEMVADPVNSTVFALDYETAEVAELNAANGSVVRAAFLGTEPDALGLAPALGRILIGDQNQPIVREFSLANQTLDRAYNTSEPGYHVGFDPLTEQLWSLDWRSVVTVTDAENGTFVATMAVGPAPVQVLYDEPAGTMVVANEGSQNLSIFNATTDQSMGSVSVPGLPLSMAVDPRYGELLVAGMPLGAGPVDYEIWSVFGDNVTTLAPIDSVASGAGLGGIALDPTDELAYIANAVPDNVTVLNVSTGEIVTTIPVGATPGALALDGTDGLLFVADYFSSDLTVIDLANDRVLGSIPVGLLPNDLALDPSGDRLYVANEGSGTISIVAPPVPPAAYAVNFTQTGLPGGQRWSVVLGFHSRTSSGPSVNFSEPNGTGYTFSVVPPAGFEVAPASGTIDVTGAALTIPLTFQTVVAPLVVAVEGSPVRVDAGQATFLACSASGGAAPLSYAWNFGDGATSTDPAPTHSYHAAGTFDAVCSVTDARGSLVTGTLSVLVLTDPTVFGPNASATAIDAGGTVQFSVNVLGGSGGYSAEWGGLPSSCAPGSAFVAACAFDLPGTYVVDLTATDSNGVSGAGTSVTVVVAPWPQVRAVTIAPATVVSGTAYAIEVSVDGGTAPFHFDYTALPAGCAATSGPTVSCRATSAGRYSIQLTVTDGAGVTAHAEANVTVGPASTPAVGPGYSPWILGAAAASVAVALVAYITVGRPRKSPPN